MRILVIDDSPVHQQSARQTLGGHDLTIVGSYDEGQKLVGKGHRFPTTLLDLLMPASRQKLGNAAQKRFMGQGFVCQEMPVGIFLALLAAKNGARYVAVFTDSNHHEHPASACFDAFNPEDACSPDVFMVEDARVVLCNGWCFLNQDEKPMSKNWGKLLDYLAA